MICHSMICRRCNGCEKLGVCSARLLPVKRCGLDWFRRLLPIVAVVMCFLAAACTKQEPKQLPDEFKYAEDTKLMLNICDKFAHEQDAKKLRDVAVATELRRVIPCANYAGECDRYLRCLSVAIDVSKSGTISADGRMRLINTLGELRVAVEQGKEKLRADWKKRRMEK